MLELFFLEFIASDQGIHVDEWKIKAIKEQPISKFPWLDNIIQEIYKDL